MFLKLSPEIPNFTKGKTRSVEEYTLNMTDPEGGALARDRGHEGSGSRGRPLPSTCVGRLHKSSGSRKVPI